MTLIVVAACPDYVVQVSDRRLARTDGAVYSDEDGKAIYLEMPAAQFLIGYKGLARIGHESTNRRLLDILMDATKAVHFSPLVTMESTTRALNSLFSGPWIRRLPVEHRRLTVMLTGYVAVAEGRPALMHGLITNFQEWGVGDSARAWDEFVFTPFSTRHEEDWPTLLQRIGQYDAWPVDLMESDLAAPRRAPPSPRRTGQDCASAARAVIGSTHDRQSGQCSDLAPWAASAVELSLGCRHLALIRG